MKSGLKSVLSLAAHQTFLPLSNQETGKSLTYHCVFTAWLRTGALYLSTGISQVRRKNTAESTLLADSLLPFRKHSDTWGVNRAGGRDCET